MMLQERFSLESFVHKVQFGEELFQRRVPIFLETDRYILKTVETYSELQMALKLRHDVFFAWGLGKKLKFELDVDSFDGDSDHLVVVDKLTSQIIGNYRVRCSLFHPKFYSEDEFVLDSLLESTEQNKIEIGRACIHPDHRSGSVIQLLWRGLLLYMRSTSSRYLFGCSSITTRVLGQVEYVWNYLRENQFLNERYHVLPKNPYVFRDTQGVSEDRMEFPALLFSYIRSGAKVLGPPAFDPEFECADFFTLLDLNDLTQKRSRRYESVLQAAVV